MADKTTLYLSIDDQVAFNLPDGVLFIDGAPAVHQAKLDGLATARELPHVEVAFVQRRNPHNQPAGRFVEEDRQAAFGETGYCVGKQARGVAGLEPVEEWNDALCFKTGNSALECDVALQCAEYEEPYSNIRPVAFRNLLADKSKVVLTGTQLKRCVLGSAVDLRAEGYAVTVLNDAAARQSIDDTRPVKEDSVLSRFLSERNIPYDPDVPINEEVLAVLQRIGCEITTVDRWRTKERLASIGIVPREHGRLPDR